MALDMRGEPAVDAYQRVVVERLFARLEPHAALRANTALLRLLSDCCRIEMNALRAPRRAVCYECGAAAQFEALLWSEQLMVLETLHVCAAHALTTQCAWLLLVLPLLVYHSVRTRRTWKCRDLVRRDALVAHLSVCAYNATVAAIHLGLGPAPGARDAAETPPPHEGARATRV